MQSQNHVNSTFCDLTQIKALVILTIRGWPSVNQCEFHEAYNKLAEKNTLKFVSVFELKCAPYNDNSMDIHLK